MKVSKVVCSRCWEVNEEEEKIRRDLLTKYGTESDDYWNEFDCEFQDRWDSKQTMCVDFEDDDLTFYCLECFKQWAAYTIDQMEKSNV